MTDWRPAPPPPSTRRLAFGLITMAVGVLTALAPAIVLRHPAGAAVGFNGTASAEGIRTFVFAEGAPVTNTPFDGGSPVAQAALDSNGSSTSFGSVAYPGDLIVSAPGLAAGVSGGKVPALPSYPLIARADSATPNSSIEQPGIAMHAVANRQDARASAQVGASQPSLSALGVGAAATVGAGPNSPAASAQSTVHGLSVAGLTFSDIRAQASAALDSGGKVLRSSSFEIKAFEVGGVRGAYSADGLTVGGAKVPLDLDSAAGQPLRSALAGAGVEMHFLAARDTPVGVVSGGLQIVMTSSNPTPVSPTRLTLTFGRVVTAMVPGTAADTSAGPLADLGGVTAAGPPAAAGAEVVPGPGGTPPLPGPSALGPTPAVSQSSASPARPASVRRPTATFDLMHMYFVIVGAALLAGGAGQVLGQRGERLRWN